MNVAAAPATVLVGVDGSSACAAAVRWAAAEAVRRRARLHAVHVVTHVSGTDLGLDPDTRLELQRARQSVPGKVGGWVTAEEIEVDVAVSVLTGDVASQLARESRDAVLVVIGTPHALRPSTLPVDLALACMCPVAMVGELGDATFVEPPVRLATEGATRARP
jgi:nucleotide-binding universal stress UspA family protein